MEEAKRKGETANTQRHRTSKETIPAKTQPLKAKTLTPPFSLFISDQNHVVKVS